jgi:hypothetical protein
MVIIDDFNCNILVGGVRKEETNGHVPTGG